MPRLGKKNLKKKIDYFWISGAIISEVERKQFREEKTRLSFEILDVLSKEQILCVYWSAADIQKGEKVSLKGRIKGDVFLVWDAIRDYLIEE